MFLRVSKYPSNAIFRNAIINAQRANVTGSMIWLTSPRTAAAYVEQDFARPMLASYYIVASEASFLVSSMARIFLYIYTVNVDIFDARKFRALWTGPIIFYFRAH